MIVLVAVLTLAAAAAALAVDRRLERSRPAPHAPEAVASTETVDAPDKAAKPLIPERPVQREDLYSPEYGPRGETEWFGEDYDAEEDELGLSLDNTDAPALADMWDHIEPYDDGTDFFDGYYMVTRVLSGNVVEIDGTGEPLRLRLAGVATPPSGVPGSPEHARAEECRRFLETLLLGEWVIMVYNADGLLTDDGYHVYDKSGAMLAKVARHPDYLHVNTEMIRLGYGAVDTEFPYGEADALRFYEQRAKEWGKGIWGRRR
jgi:endonuclease YncB( thermonuclease family)